MTPSDGERSIVLTPFWESRVSSTMHQSSSERPRHVILLSPLIPPLVPSLDRLFAAGKLRSISLLEGGGGSTVPSKRLRSTALLPSSEIELARNGSGSWRRRAPMFLLFFNLSIVSDTIFARVAYSSVNISTAFDDGNLKKIQDVSQLAFFLRKWGCLTH